MALVILGALLTVAAADVGLQLASRLWSDYVEEAGEECPAPAPAPAVAPPPVPVVEGPPSKDTGVTLLSVREDGVEIDVRGERHLLPRYPWPADRGKIAIAAEEPSGEEIAIAENCHAEDDSDHPPRCAQKFVRIYRVLDGAHVRDLRMPWGIMDGERRPLAMAFDGSGERLAVLVRAAWSDCSWDGDQVELIVYSVGDGRRILRRVLEKNDRGGTRLLTVEGDEVRIVTMLPHRQAKVRVVQLPGPSP